MKFEPDCIPLRYFTIEGSELNMTDALTKYDVPRKLNKYPTKKAISEEIIATTACESL